MIAYLFASVVALYTCSTAELYDYPARAVRTVDGDTIVADVTLRPDLHETEHLRLLGVDTPELHAKDPAVRQQALDAALETSKRVTGKQLIVHLDRKDDFGRWLAEVWVDGRCLNADLSAHWPYGR